MIDLMVRSLKPLLLVAVPLAFALPARSGVRDFAVLRNGRVLAVTGVEPDGDRIRLVLASGGELRVPATMLERVDREAGASPAAASQPSPTAPLPAHPWRETMARAARVHGVDARLVDAVARVESALDPTAVSPRGAMGLMQLMPATARDLGVTDPFDPVQSIDGGCRYLKQLLERFDGDLPRALAAYNAGPRAVVESGGVPEYAETKSYVARVLATLARL